MCGRFTLRTPLHQLSELFLFELHAEDVPPRFNIAPSQPVVAVRVMESAAGRQLAWLRWGLIPSWAKDRAIANQLINARGETVAEKPSFRQAFARRRCLVLADGYYEWQKLGASKKQPYYIRLRGDRPFALAGLWESWQGEPGAAVETCTIITTAANALTEPLHPRMPVILADADHDRWLDPHHRDREALLALLRPFDAAAMELYPVDPRVNSPRQDDVACIRPLAAGAGPAAQRSFAFDTDSDESG
ncbi:MAG: SOS response-associated peptidase [Pirellulaceae bacterium]|jgi:putative SOS response-associated peptidase YedK|nr:SOS response-associated peptidase [Pirellulaceae bacterium]